MRARWKILGGAGAIGIGLAFSILGHSRDVSGDSSEPATSQSSTTGATAGIPADQLPDPMKPHDPGTSAIPYESLDAAARAGVDQIQEVVETAQPDSSHQAFATATSWSAASASRSISPMVGGAS